MYGPVSLQKVRFEENLKEVSRQAFNSVIYREDVDLFPIFDVRARMNTVMRHTPAKMYGLFLIIPLLIFPNLICNTKKQELVECNQVHLLQFIVAVLTL